MRPSGEHGHRSFLYSITARHTKEVGFCFILFFKGEKELKAGAGSDIPSARKDVKKPALTVCEARVHVADNDEVVCV